MQNKFTQPVSMQVTKEQYERDLREPLLRMGYYEEEFEEWEDIHVLVTNFANTRGEISNTSKWHKEDYNRHFIDHYNPKLFLAIAAMTNEELGIVGEWWKCTKNNSESFALNKLYKCELFRGGTPEFTDEQGRLNGYITTETHLLNFTKSTLQELITNFTENKQEKKVL